MTETQTVDLTAWPTPPCPHCGRDVKALRIESYDGFDVIYTAPTRVPFSRLMNLQPCGHPISGYVVQGEQVEWDRADEGGAMTETTDKKLCDHCYAGLHGDCAEADCTCECNAPDEATTRGVEW